MPRAFFRRMHPQRLCAASHGVLAARGALVKEQNMHRFIAPALFAAMIAAPAAAEMRDLSGFDEIHASDRIRVEVTVGGAYSVEVTGADANRVRTRLDGDELRISDARRPWFGRTPELDALVRVTTPELEGVAASRGAELNANLSDAPCVGFSAAAAMGGAATVDGLRCEDVDASAAMGGIVRLAGACRSLDVSAAMGGMVRADGLECELVDASAAMGGEIRAFASQSYDASAAMGGAVNVGGGARSSDRSAVMGGSISESN